MEVELQVLNMTPQELALRMMEPGTFLDTVAMIAIRNMLEVSYVQNLQTCKLVCLCIYSLACLINVVHLLTFVQNLYFLVFFSVRFSKTY